MEQIEDRTRKDLIKLINDLYNVESISSKRVFGINWWPAIRLQCGYVLTSIWLKGRAIKDKQVLQYEKVSLFWLKELINYLKTSIQLFYARKRYSDRLKSKVLIAGFEHFETVVDGQQINIHASPFAEALDGIGVSSEIMLIEKQSPLPANNLESLFSLLKRHYTLKSNLKRALSPRYNLEYKKLFELAQSIKEHFGAEGIDCAEYIGSKVQWRIKTNEIIYQAAIAFLKITRPSHVINCVYENNTMLALQRAANHLAIPITEYQHGSQDDGHYAYALWKNSDNYSCFFPSQYWVWSESDAKRIVTNFYDTLYKPPVIVGGNVFLAQQKTNSIKEPSAKKGILVALQGGWIPRFIEELVENRKDFRWFFRLHPRNPDDKGKLIALHKKYPENVEMDEANTLPLYSLFKKVNFQITSFSSTALEGPAFKVASIIFGQDGYRQYESFIKNKQFHFVEDAATLEQLLDSNLEITADGSFQDMQNIKEKLKIFI